MKSPAELNRLLLKVPIVMSSGYSAELSQKQCGIQLSRINLGESKVLKNAFSRLFREPKIPNFGNHGATSKYTGFIKNLPF